ncbi:hypothetical protein Pint_26350 [Pistacia integerrima]|uniref:Uncharacterized protein n=1 Tax=Pistacia integerrima TaxID=434235 RepID=A0ACC0YF37_9ROSI|nr:hypothetical protein Pint_26350 [Pistacia integerrima]
MVEQTQRTPSSRPRLLPVAQLRRRLFLSQEEVNGGNLDAKGAGFWNCRKFGQNCPVEAGSITFNWVNNIQIGLTSINSLPTHLVINSCNNVIVRNVKLIAPDESPNADGIHIQSSTSVIITGSILQTGDDCISIGPGTRNLLMDNIKCGPGHGISIGSLARSFKEDGVENIKVTNTVFTGSDNGVRIKSWARPSTGFVRNAVFKTL